MSDNADRLRRCFSLVFPSLPENAISAASVRTVADWDSLANINLLTVIEEEFGIAIAAADLPKLTSFQLLADYLDAHDIPRAWVLTKCDKLSRSELARRLGELAGELEGTTIPVAAGSEAGVEDVRAWIEGALAAARRRR